MKVSIFDLLDGPCLQLETKREVPAGPVFENDGSQNRPTPEPASRLAPDTILELWEERAAILASENPVEHTNIPPVTADTDFETRRKYWQKVRRFWELCAAADLANQHGDYVLAVIRPHIKADTIKGGEPTLQRRPA